MTGRGEERANVCVVLVTLAVCLVCLVCPRRGVAQGAGASFAAEVQHLYAAVACTSTTAAPPGHDAGAVLPFCAGLAPVVERFRRNDALIARPFFAALAPAELPEVAVYPFGSGDAAYALMTYPNLRELVIVAEEPIGDVRGVLRLPPRDVARSLTRIRALAERLLSTGLVPPPGLSGEPAGYPPRLALLLLGLAVHGYRPIALRYFEVQDDGSHRYLDEAELERCPAPRAGRPAPACRATASAELLFSRPGEEGHPRVIRHLSTRLSDPALRHSPALRSLERLGRVSALAKGSGYGLWLPGYSVLRDYLLGNMALMISDSGGVPPALARRAGFVQQGFGRYFGLADPRSAEHDRELQALFSSPATRTLLLRYGHVDREERMHLVVTRPGAGEPSPPARQGRVGAERTELLPDPAGGRHLRLWTDEGAVHVYFPPGYQAERAGTVIYAHGYYVNADEAWAEHALGEQLVLSGRNARLIVPDASSSDADAPFWPDLEVLLETVNQAAGGRAPPGPLVVLAHSGGFRTILPWLGAPRLGRVVLIDALYGKPLAPIRAWLAGDPTGRTRTLVLTSSETADRSALLARSTRGSVTLPELPERVEVLGPEAQRARLLYLETNLEHMELVTGRKVIPLLLQLGPLGAVPRP